MHRKSTEQTESIQKQALINALKKQLYDFNETESRFMSLHDDITRAEGRLCSMKDARDRIEREGKIRLEINRKNIAELRNQVDSLKIQNHKCNVLIEDMTRENNNLNRSCDHKQSQVAALLNAAQQLEGSNQRIVEDNRAFAGKIKTLKEERNKNDQEIQRLSRLLDELVGSLKSLEKEARGLQSSNNKLQNILHQAEKDHSELVSEAQSQEEKVNLQNKRLDQLSREIEEVRTRSKRFEHECEKSKLQLNNTITQLESAIQKSRSISKELKQLQQHMRNIENQLDRAILQRDELQQQNQELINEHRLLNNEVDRIIVQIIEFEQINGQLQHEIANYIESDETARAMLNRKDAMRSLLDTVISKLSKTKQQIAHLR